MRILALIILLGITSIGISQDESFLIGEWKEVKQITNDGIQCDFLINSNMTLVFSIDNSYVCYPGKEFQIVGKWKMEDDQVYCFDNKYIKVGLGSIPDYSCGFEINTKNQLVLDGYVCGEKAGFTYYEKQ
jgi:hypothetical protein